MEIITISPVYFCLTWKTEGFGNVLFWHKNFKMKCRHQWTRILSHLRRLYFSPSFQFFIKRIHAGYSIIVFWGYRCTKALFMLEWHISAINSLRSQKCQTNRIRTHYFSVTTTGYPSYELIPHSHSHVKELKLNLVLESDILIGQSNKSPALNWLKFNHA